MASRHGVSTHIPQILIALLLSVVGVQAVVIQAGVYGPSDASQLDNSACGSTLTCSDSSYAAKTSIASLLSDQSPLSAAVFRNTTGTNAHAFSATWYMDIAQTGTYYMQFQVGNSFTGENLYVIPYSNLTDVDTNVSNYVVKPITLTNNNWMSIDVTAAVKAAYANFGNNGIVKLRFMISSTAADQIAELYLVAPADMSFQIIPMGVSQAEIDTNVESEWVLVTPNRFNLTLSNGSCIIADPNGTTMNISSLSTITEMGEDNLGRHLTAFWMLNSSEGVQEGHNYEVKCSMNVDGGGYRLNSLEQYIYVNPHKTIMTALGNFYTYVLQLIGFQRSPVKITIIPQTVSSTGSTNIVVSAVKGDKAINGTNSSCDLTVVDSTGTVLVNNQSMSVFGVSTIGMFNYSMNSTAGTLPYAVQAVCAVNDSTNTFGNYMGSGTLNPALLTPTLIFEGTPKINLLGQVYHLGSVNQVIAQLEVGSLAVANANCNLTVYYNNFTKLVNNQPMTYAGDDGMYYYNWTPTSSIGNYPARVACYGGSLGTMIAQTSASMTVQNGIQMQVIS